MSLEYTLAIAGTKQHSKLVGLLSRVSGYRLDGEGVTALGLHIDLVESGPLESETISEEFGFQPRFSITFRLDKEAESVAIRARLLLGCFALLGDSADDAVLLFNGETVIFLRRNARLVLNPVEGFWTKEVLALVPNTFEFETIRSI